MLRRIWRWWNNLFAGDIFKWGKVFNLINYAHAFISYNSRSVRDSQATPITCHANHLENLSRLWVQIPFLSSYSVLCSWTWQVILTDPFFPPRCNDMLSRSTRILDSASYVTHDLCVFRWNHGVHYFPGESIWKRKNEDVRRYVSGDRMHNHNLHNLAFDNLTIICLIETFRYCFLLCYWGFVQHT